MKNENMIQENLGKSCYQHRTGCVTGIPAHDQRLIKRLRKFLDRKMVYRSTLKKCLRFPMQNEMKFDSEKTVQAQDQRSFCCKITLYVQTCTGNVGIARNARNMLPTWHTSIQLCVRLKLWSIVCQMNQINQHIFAFKPHLLPALREPLLKLCRHLADALTLWSPKKTLALLSNGINSQVWPVLTKL